MKELKAVDLRERPSAEPAREVESGEGIERTKTSACLPEVLSQMWNPVKELKVKLHRVMTRAPATHVESGEGIERFG